MGDLVGTKEIAEYLGLQHPETVHLYRKSDKHYGPGSEHPFPEPVAHLAIGHVWSMADVKRWQAERKKRRAARSKGGAK